MTTIVIEPKEHIVGDNTTRHSVHVDIYDNSIYLVQFKNDVGKDIISLDKSQAKQLRNILNETFGDS